MNSESKAPSPKRNPFMRVPVLRFFSSVKLAVPLMLALAVIVAVGTIYESRYNAQIASLHIYRSFWFQGLLCLLWVNIFCATVSRLPFRKGHTGFVITHIGLLTLLIGSLMTSIFGIDGNLRILVGKRDRTVYLPDLVLKVWPEKEGAISGPPLQTIPVPRRLEPRGSSELGFEDFSRSTGILIDRYLPFVRVTEGGSAVSAGGGTAVAFGLKSKFFNVSETLDSAGKSSMQLGPAQLRLVVGGKKAARHPKAKAKPVSGVNELWVKKGTTVAKKISLKGAAGKLISVGEYKIEIVKLYRNAVVDQGKLVERAEGGPNPAVEFNILAGEVKTRDITFGKFLGFTVQKAPVGDLHFELHTPEGAGDAESDGGVSASAAEISASGMGNEILFSATPGDSKNLTIYLFKGGKIVLEKVASLGETIVTPWMGMEITITSITSGAEGAHAPQSASGPSVQPIELEPKTNLPPSAMHARLFDQPADDGFWLVENSEQTVQTSKGNFRVYYGMNSIELPFDVQLESFSKKDYPGTETAMSFESVIRLNGVGEPILVMMNEPLSYQGFFLYQSSYEMGMGMETASIFSVNQDPGRWVKYIGAIVLCLGIVVFTLMRSRWYLDLERKKRSLS